MMEKRRVTQNITIENARIGFRNFSGKEGRFNPAGRRNFCVFLDTDIATRLEADGWNVRWLEPKEEGDDRQAYLQVAVSFDHIRPKILMMTGSNKTLLDEQTVGALDWAEIGEIDLIIRPYNWIMHAGTKSETSGVKAYVKSMYIQLVEDKFEKKWANAPVDEDVSE